MKKYALFAGSDHCPSGGWQDLKDTADTKETLYEHIARGSYSHEWWHIADLESGVIVDSK
jgi:hypothetical protein